MISCKAAMCAESVVTDSRTNNVSVLNIVEQMNTMGFPAVSQKLVYFFFLTRDKTNAEIQKGSLVLSLDGKKMNSFPVRIDFQGKLRTRIILTIEGFVIPKPGTLRAILKLRGKEYGRWDIHVEQIAEPKVETSGT